MNGFSIQQPGMLLALLCVPAVLYLFRRARRKRTALLQSLGAHHAAHTAQILKSHRRRETFTLIALVLLGVAMSRPGANPRPSQDPRGGRDVIFLLDVSRSMLAEDIRPNRLERAKLDIESCLNLRSYNRVGLVVFAGVGAIRCPLTTDYEFFRTMLRNTTTDSAALGSTYLQSALEKTIDQMMPKERPGLQDIILLTDGEDQGSHPERTLSELNATGARLLVVGYGNPQLGSRIPLQSDDPNATGYVMDEGREVWTKLREENLRSLAEAANQGQYIRGGSAGFNLGLTYTQWSAPARKQIDNDQEVLIYDEYFPWLLIPAILLLLPSLRRASHPVMGALLLGILACTQFVTTGHAAPPPAEINLDDNLTEQERNEPDLNRRIQLVFQRGLTALQTYTFSEAVKAFDTAASMSQDPRKISASLYNAALANAEYAAQAQDPDQQIDLLNQSINRIRRALLLRPDWPNATLGLEILYARRSTAEIASKQKQEQVDQMNQMIDALIAELKRILELQKQLITETSSKQTNRPIVDEQKLNELKQLGVRQSELKQETESASNQLGLIQKFIRSIITDTPAVVEESTDKPIETSYDQAMTHLVTATKSQGEAAEMLNTPDKTRSAVQLEKAAADEIVAALNALSTSQPNDPSDEAPPSDEESEGEPSDEESESSESENQSMQAAADFVSDPASRELPKPNFDPQDILEEERQNAAVREKSKPARVKTGEKDW